MSVQVKVKYTAREILNTFCYVLDKLLTYYSWQQLSVFLMLSEVLERVFLQINGEKCSQLLLFRLEYQ